MNCVLFAKMDQVLSKENKTPKKYWKIGKILEKLGKSQGILSFWKSGNPVSTHLSVPIHPSVCAYPPICLCLSTKPSVCLSTKPSVCLSANLCPYPPNRLYAYPPIYVYLSTQPSVCLSTNLCLPIHPTVCMPIHGYPPICLCLSTIYVPIHPTVCMPIHQSMSTYPPNHLYAYPPIYVYLSTQPSVCLSMAIHPSAVPIHPYVCMAIDPSTVPIHPSVCVPIHPTVCMPIHQSISLSTQLSVCLSTQMSVCAYPWLSTHLLFLSTHLSVFLSTQPSVCYPTICPYPPNRLFPFYPTVCMPIHGYQPICRCLSTHLSVPIHQSMSLSTQPSVCLSMAIHPSTVPIHPSMSLFTHLSVPIPGRQVPIFSYFSQRTPIFPIF